MCGKEKFIGTWQICVTTFLVALREPSNLFYLFIFSVKNCSENLIYVLSNDKQPDVSGFHLKALLLCSHT